MHSRAYALNNVNIVRTECFNKSDFVLDILILYALNNGMQRLEAKSVNGHTYYYLSQWGWKNGKCRRLSQVYLGKLDSFAHKLTGTAPAPDYAEVMELGRPLALWNAVQQSKLIELADQLCPKRKQGLSPGTYLALAAVNRAMQPCSKQGLWDWLQTTVLVEHLENIGPKALRSQRFWDNFSDLEPEQLQALWKQLLEGLLRQEAIDLSRLCYDGTNFYTFIDTFNVRSSLARRGKNKQGRANLRQVSYGLVCAARGQWPLYYQVYEGNRNDSQQFGQMLERFVEFYRSLRPQETVPPSTTLIFDKGNNSAVNFALIDSFGLDYVGSVKLCEVPELAAVSNSRDGRWQECSGIEGTKAFRVRRKLYGKERDLIVSWSKGLFQAQRATMDAELARAVKKLQDLKEVLERRRQGLVRCGRKPTVQQVRKQAQQILGRERLGMVVKIEVKSGDREVPVLDYRIDSEGLEKLEDTFLGKTILVTSQTQWTDSDVIEAYRSQYLIEDVFRRMKDRDLGCWWPMYHWTDWMIQVHGFYCTAALLLRAMVAEAARAGGLQLPVGRLWAELAGIKKVVNVYERAGAGGKHVRQDVLSKLTTEQKQLMEALNLQS